MPAGAPIGEHFAWADAVVGRAIELAPELTDFEVDFAQSMADRLERFGPRTFVSPAQWDVLLALEEKLGRA